MNLTRNQMSAIVGMILGDGYLQPTGKNNARLRLEQKASHKAYLLWKARLIPRLFQGDPVLLERKHPITKKTYSYACHQSNSSPVLGKIRKLFYPEGVKRIPADLLKFIQDDVAFAIWFYDDGYYYGRDKCSYLYLGRVSREEAETASEAVLKRFGIVSRVLDKKLKGFALYFPHSESKKIQTILAKHYVPVMAYKIPS